MKSRLLSERDVAPVMVARSGGSSRWLLTADHAGNAIPSVLDSLGVSPEDLADHIGIDIGIWGVTQRLADQLDATAIGQAYSRLVIDCNRRPGTPTSIPTVSDGREVPGNVGVDTQSRVDEIFAPDHGAIDERLRPDTLLAAMHSFTREMSGARRTVDVGVIYGPRSRLADVVFEALAHSGLRVERNEPYRIDFTGDYTIPVHAEGRGLDYVEIEICQDLIGDDAGQTKLATMMSSALQAAQLSLS